jgi:hypothetical protein
LKSSRTASENAVCFRLTQVAESLERMYDDDGEEYLDEFVDEHEQSMEPISEQRVKQEPIEMEFDEHPS